MDNFRTLLNNYIVLCDGSKLFQKVTLYNEIKEGPDLNWQSVFIWRLTIFIISEKQNVMDDVYIYIVNNNVSHMFNLEHSKRNRSNRTIC